MSQEHQTAVGQRLEAVRFENKHPPILVPRVHFAHCLVHRLPPELLEYGKRTGLEYPLPADANSVLAGPACESQGSVNFAGFPAPATG